MGTKHVANRRLSQAQVRALQALASMDAILVCEGEHNIFGVREKSFPRLVEMGFAVKQDGAVSITDEGRAELARWPC